MYYSHVSGNCLTFSLLNYLFSSDDNDEDDSEDEENPLTREELAKRSTII